MTNIALDPRVDRMRGLLSLGVMLGHTFDLAMASVTAPSGMWAQILGSTRPYFGFVCVVGFVALSGYCIARSTLAGFRPGRYALARITRLYPLLIAVTLLAGAFEWSALGQAARPAMWNGGQTVQSFLYNLFGLGGYFGQFGAMAPTYTVSYELFYYLVWGLALVLAGARAWLALVFSALLAAVLIAFGEPLRQSLGPNGWFLHPLGLALLPVWLLGALIVVVPYFDRLAKLIPPWGAWLLLLAVIAHSFDNWQKPRTAVVDISDVKYFIEISFVFVVAMAAWLARPAPSANATDRWLGEVSYPLFLSHGPTVVGFQYVLNKLNLSFDFQLHFSILVAVNIIVATALIYLVERPVMLWRRRRLTGKQLSN